MVMSSDWPLSVQTDKCPSPGHRILISVDRRRSRITRQVSEEIHLVRRLVVGLATSPELDAKWQRSTLNLLEENRNLKEKLGRSTGFSLRRMRLLSNNNNNENVLLQRDHYLPFLSFDPHLWFLAFSLFPSLKFIINRE